MRKAMILALVGAAFLAAGCGYREDLQRPPPLWGEDRTAPEAEEDEQPQQRPEAPRG